MRQSRKPKPRRGVLLLIVLGMLAMFGLIGMAFVLMAGQARRTAETQARVGQYAHQPEAELGEAAMQVLRGTNSPASVLGPHSLLEDVYSSEVTPGIVLASTDGASGLPPALDTGQIIIFHVDAAHVGNPYRHVGCLLTMLNGPAAMRSMRIVHCLPSKANPEMFQFQVVVPEGVDASELITFLNNSRCEFFINRMPFSGTGFGYNSLTGLLDAMDTSDTLPLALLPNDQLNRNPAGGANEDYDAVDYQDLLLAMVVLPGDNSGIAVPIPSLHRPALIQYWATLEAGGDWTALGTDRLRQIMLRPLGGPNGDHPDFTGGNPKFNAAWDGQLVDGDGDGVCDYQWDVDNDGDGVADSIWVDLGLPVRSTRDGRLYKPLFAVLCVDLDGRLNLNAHGCLAQTNDTDGNDAPDINYYAQAPAGTSVFAGGLSQAPLPRGQGCGPAEVNLFALFLDTGGLDAYRRLLIGNGTIDGRYGESGQAIRGPGVANFNDPLSINRQFDYPINYDASISRDCCAYGSPADMKGSLAVGLDLRGQPIYYNPTNTRADNPYELNLSRNAPRGLASGEGVDNLFSAAELERILRPYDVDANMLPNRLVRLTGTELIGRRHEITTDSWSIPCPSPGLTPELRKDAITNGLLPGNRARHIIDLLLAKGVQQNQVANLLSIDLLAGRPLDLNRPFGNGKDDNNPGQPGYGVVDEPGEALVELTTLVNRVNNPVEVPFDANNDGVLASAPSAEDPRQIYARHLYVLAMLLTDQEGFTPPGWIQVDWDGLPPGPEKDAERARALAQWAVNVVDFRDRDAIMTAFQYDIDPWDDWNPTNLEHVVWGCERPELLITETGAWHDRCTKDTALEPDGHTTQEAPPDNDDDFDQVERPQGVLFIELYNPTSIVEPKPGEFYDVSKAANLQGVELDQRTPTGHPVWRLVIVPKDDWDKDPDDPTEADRPTIERSVYFFDPGAAALGTDGKRYYTTDQIAQILPDRYAVIGPAETNYVGERTTAQPDQTRRILLDPNTDPNDSNEQVDIRDNKTQHSDDLPTGEIKRPIAVIIPGLNVSEPLSSPPYPLVEEATGQYNPAWDIPLDDERADDNAVLVQEVGTKSRVFVVHLQRLANPLEDYDTTTNPYRTVDAMPIDLTTFNGSESEADPSVPSDTVMFESHQRGETNLAADGVNNLWKRRLELKPVQESPKEGEIDQPAVNHCFRYVLQHTLGYLNKPFEPRTPGARGGTYTGVPQAMPFPWLTWNNRPFVSEMELLLVPAVSSGKLLEVYDVATGTPDPYVDVQSPFPHLLNLFQSSDADPAEGNSAQLHRLLAFLDVPSRYVGTDIQCNPTMFSGNGDLHHFHPPFNRISKYREPGKINLNTVFSRNVWLGLMNFFPNTNPSDTSVADALWAEFLLSRQGYAPGNMLQINSAVPTRFAGPFRSAAGGYMVPLDVLKPKDSEVDATLLRRSPDPARNGQPLFSYASAVSYNDTDRNPFFRYQLLDRLGNLVTTRSNVYAVWLTVGYFEVTYVGVNAAHLDGYALGQELGSDTGEVERHRAFYIFDRSIPVGFQRGEDLNVQNTILLERFIE